MGHEIEKMAIQRGHSIIAIFDKQEDWNNPIPDADVVIDFSTPETAPELVQLCLKKGLPVISGTTGWNDKLPMVKEIALKNGGAFFYASNFSIGVNIFYKINSLLASLLCKIDEYGVNIHEIHHIHKTDAPSGTAITLGNQIIAACNRYDKWALNEGNTNTIRITSERIGEIPGTHIITWESEIDSIEIKHTANNRKGLALGAVMAAEWLQGRKGVFGMEDLLGELLEK